MDSHQHGGATCSTIGSDNDMQRILILGGTSEARQLSERLAARPDLVVTLSLAGRTAAPARQGVPTRVGGFGGPEGLANYLEAERIDTLIDATHPYAAIISANAAWAAEQKRVRLLALRRPLWSRLPGDSWTEVADAEAAAKVLGTRARARVFLALGRNDIRPFERAPQHRYLVRSVDPVDPQLAVPNATYIVARGPFLQAAERELLISHRTEIIVSKNSGGPAAYGKIAAARELRVAVLMLRRPRLPEVPFVETIEEAVSWVDHAAVPRIERGV
jgi:precorrin-6A/cobalt-precorrin-6A reductase